AGGVLDDVVDDAVVVSGDGRVAAVGQGVLGGPQVGDVDIALIGVGDLRRLQVGALHDTQVGLVLHQHLQVALGAVEVGLEDDADVVVAGAAQVAVDQQGDIDAAGLLHVDAHEGIQRGGVL